MKISEINRQGIWPAVIAAGGALAGGVIAGRAAGQAADYQKDAAKVAAELQREMYYQSRADLAPWREGGEQAINVLRQKMGLDYYDPSAEAIPAGAGTVQMQRVPIYGTKRVKNPNYKTGDWDTGTGVPRTITKRVITGYRNVPMQSAGAGADATGRMVEGTGELAIPEFTESPGYQFTLSEGQRAIQNTLSAMGRNRSGKHLRAATAHAEGLASTEYDNFLNRWYRSLNPYFSMAGMGQQAVNTGANLGASAATNMGQAAMAGGQAQAGGAINQANALTGAISGGANALLYYNALRNLQSPQQQKATGYTPYQPGAINYSSRPVDQWQYASA